MNSELKAPICNYINLAAAIFGADPQLVADKVGVKLPVKHPPKACHACGEPRTNPQALYCENCRFIPVACLICGKICYVRRAFLFRKNEKQRPRFCSNKCKGIFSGNTYGFKAHPRKAIE